MDSAKLEYLEQKLKRITPLPWHKQSCDIYGWEKKCRVFVARTAPIVVGNSDKLIRYLNNADYVTAACNAVPELITENRKFQECTRELERQNDFFLKALKENFMCPYSRCKYDDGSELDEWECDAENNRECWIKAAKEAGEC